jgi:hypothetical protein
MLINGDRNKSVQRLIHWLHDSEVGITFPAGVRHTRLLHYIQIGSELHSASYLRARGLFPRLF